MALRDHPVPVLITISDPWLDPNVDRPLLASKPVIAPWLPILEAAHNNLVHLEARRGKIETRVATLTGEMSTDDVYGDRKGRGVYGALSAAGELADTPADASAFVATRDTLFSEGLSVLRYSYPQQAGYATQVRAKLTPEVRAVLSRIKIDDRPVLDDTLAWLDTAEGIGKKFNERARISGDSDDAITRGDLHRARLAWIRVYSRILNAFEYAGFTDDERRRLLAPLVAAEGQALRSRSNAPGGRGSNEAPTGAASEDDVLEQLEELNEMPDLPDLPELRDLAEPVVQEASEPETPPAPVVEETEEV